MSWAAVFPGQGSQHSGMGKFLFEEFKIARLAFEEASDAIGVNFQKLCFEAPESELALTHNTQPCLLLVSTATFRVLQEVSGFSPVAAAGHSIGEYAAIVTAGALSLSEGIRAVRARGEAMQAAVPVGQGAMAAVMGLEPEQVRTLCSWAEKKCDTSPLEPANFNAPGQIVISGRASIIEWAQKNLDLSIFSPATPKVRLIPLKVSAPFHCSLMKPAEEKMRTLLQSLHFSPARFPIVQNFTAQPHQTASELREHLIRQISAPVLWIDCIEQLKTLGATSVVECGPGKVLNGLIKKIDEKSYVTYALNSLEDLRIIEAKIRS